MDKKDMVRVDCAYFLNRCWNLGTPINQTRIRAFVAAFMLGEAAPDADAMSHFRVQNDLCWVHPIEDWHPEAPMDGRGYACRCPQFKANGECAGIAYVLEYLDLLQPSEPTLKEQFLFQYRTKHGTVRTKKRKWGLVSRKGPPSPFLGVPADQFPPQLIFIMSRSMIQLKDLRVKRENLAENTHNGITFCQSVVKECQVLKAVIRVSSGCSHPRLPVRPEGSVLQWEITYVVDSNIGNKIKKRPLNF